MKKQEEEFRDIPGYEGLYQVSNLGRVKSLKFSEEKILNNNINSGGYYRVGLYKDKNKLYIYDSFARQVNNLLNKFTDSAQRLGYQVIGTNLDGDQGNYQDDCGLRSLAWAMLTNKYGINDSKEI